MLVRISQQQAQLWSPSATEMPRVLVMAAQIMGFKQGMEDHRDCGMKTSRAVRSCVAAHKVCWHSLFLRCV